MVGKLGARVSRRDVKCWWQNLIIKIFTFYVGFFYFETFLFVAWAIKFELQFLLVVYFAIIVGTIIVPTIFPIFPNLEERSKIGKKTYVKSRIVCN